MTMPRPIRKAPDFERWIEALLSPEWETRLNATEALGKMKDKRAVKPLLATLKDEDEYVREGAAWGLGQIRDQSVVPALIAAIKDKDKYVRESAVTSLGDLGDKRAVKPLIQALRDGDESMRRTTEKALLNLGEPVIDELVLLLQDSDWDIRWRAIHVLGPQKQESM